MQDLAGYVAEHWPVQAQPSKQSMAIAEASQPAGAAYGLLSVKETLAGILKDVVAAEIPTHQPFMDVRDLPHVILLPAGTKKPGM